MKLLYEVSFNVEINTFQCELIVFKIPFVVSSPLSDISPNILLSLGYVSFG